MLLGLYTTDLNDTLDRARLAPAGDLPPTGAEAFSAAYEESRRFANSEALTRNRHEITQKALDALEDATGEYYANPETVAQGPNRDALERQIRARFENLRGERPDLNLSYPEEPAIQAGAVELAAKARGARAAVDARPQDVWSFGGALLGDVAGTATDPLQIVSMFAGAGAASGILRTMAVEAGIAATTQAGIEAGTAGFKQAADPSYGLPEAVGNIAMAGAGAAVISGGIKVAGKGLSALLRRARGADAAPLPREAQDAMNVAERDEELRGAAPLPGVAGEVAHIDALKKAAADMEAGRPVDVQAIQEEARQLASAYDQVRATPAGAPDDPLVHIQPEDIDSVIVARGGWKGLGDVEVKGSGWGLVKFIWRHGEASKKAAELQITRDDLVSFPEIVRTREATVERRADGSVSREWRVMLPGTDGADRLVIFADGPVSGREGQHLVTVYVQEPGRVRGERAESPLKTGPTDSPSKLLQAPRGDTAEGILRAPEPGRTGNDNMAPNAGRVYTPSGRAVDVEYRVVEADSLIASHTAEGVENPAFPTDLQPRDRTRVSSQAQIAEMAGQLEPERLGRSTDAATGAPIVGPDMVVESGNGRVAAVRTAYETGGDAAARYRSWVAQQHPEATGMQRPVLVAVRKTDLDGAGRSAFTREANAATAARLSPTEQAMADARHLDGNLMERVGSGDVNAASNRAFVRGFLDRLPAAERGALVDADGALNTEGARRVQGALLGRAYGDAAIIGRIVEDADSDIRAIGGALLDVAGPWAKLRAAAARGELAPGMDVTGDLLAAVRVVAESRRTGESIADIINQRDFFASVPDWEIEDALWKATFGASADPEYRRLLGAAEAAGGDPFKLDRLFQSIAKDPDNLPGRTIAALKKKTPTEIVDGLVARAREWRAEFDAKQAGLDPVESAVREVLDRIAPGAKASLTRESPAELAERLRGPDLEAALAAHGKKKGGVAGYVTGTGRGTTVVVALNRKDAEVMTQITVRHETVHALRSMGLFTDDEWRTLERAAREQGWLECSGKADTADGVEEAIADAFGLWGAGAKGVIKEGTPYADKLENLFGRIFDFFAAVVDKLAGRGVTDWERVFADIENGVIGGRENVRAVPGRDGSRASSGGVRLTPVGQMILDGMFRDPGTYKKPAGRQRVADFLKGYLDEASKNSAEARLFGEPLSAEQILKGERMTAASTASRPAEEMAGAPEMHHALYQDVNRLLADRDVEVPVERVVDADGNTTVLRRNALDLMDEADREIQQAGNLAACVFGMAAE